MIKFHHIRLSLLRAERKRESVSLASALFAWFAILACASAILLVGAAYAYYAFTKIDTAGGAVVKEEPRTVAYKKVSVDTALERYRAKKAYFAEEASQYSVQTVATSTTARVETSATTTTTTPSVPRVVASSTEEGVE